MKFEYFFRTRSFFVLAISLFSGYSMAATYYWEKSDPNPTEITGTFLMYPFADSVPLQCGWGYFCNDDIQLCNLDYGKLNPELSGKDSTLVSVGTDVSMGSGKMLVSKIDKSLGGSCKIPPSCADRPDIALGKKSDLTFSYITSANGVSTAVYGSVTSQGITYPLKYTTDDKGDSAYYSSVSGCYYYLNDLSEDVFLKSLDVADSDFMENLKKIIDSGSDKSDGSGGSTSGGSSGGSTSGGSSSGSTSGGSSGDDDGWLGDILGWLQRIWSSVNDLNKIFSVSQSDMDNALNSLDNGIENINKNMVSSLPEGDFPLSDLSQYLPGQGSENYDDSNWLTIDLDKLLNTNNGIALPFVLQFSFNLPLIGVIDFKVDTTDFAKAYDYYVRSILEYTLYMMTMLRVFVITRRTLFEREVKS
ncbi:hypothetical protein [Escherichia coli]|uniref:hypothetical protein n=1 Tax=Escherichia coli TaxID=562 RepID=UPI0007A07C17|nr:hypothetical protein [Escherichia coli]KYR40034.1 hypothetical protein AML05_15345 [Escherichia coli]